MEEDRKDFMKVDLERERIEKILEENKIFFTKNGVTYEDLIAVDLEPLLYHKLQKFVQEKKENGFYILEIRNPETKQEYKTEIKYEGGKEPEKEEKETEKTLELNKELFEEIKKTISKYVDTTPQNIEILSLWVLGTYFHKDFETFPLLQFIAQKRSGKSRTLKLLSSISSGSDGSVSTSPTETLLFRHKEGALFFDEMENISSKERGAFRETLNAVYKKGNKIIRYREIKKDGIKDWVEEAFYPYYPLGLANISGFGDVLGDRAVQIILRRSNKRLTKLVEDFLTNKNVLSLKKKLNQLKATIPENFFSDWNNYIEGKELQKEELKPLFEKINETEIYGRSLEIFFPLFIISYLCDDIDNFLKTAKDYITMKEEEESVDDIDERLKEFINKREETGFVNLSSLLKDFRESFETPEEWVNSKWFGRALKRLGLIKQKRTINGRVQITINYTIENKQVEFVEFIGEKGLVDENIENTKTQENLSKFTDSEIKQTGFTREEYEKMLKGGE